MGRFSGSIAQTARAWSVSLTIKGLLLKGTRSFDESTNLVHFKRILVQKLLLLGLSFRNLQSRHTDQRPLPDAVIGRSRN